MALTTQRSGFVETLEVILASLLFFIFLINVLPTFIGGDGAEAVTRTQVINTLAALDADGQLRHDVAQRDLAALNDTIASYFPLQDVSVELVWANITQGTTDRSIELPDPTDRVVVRAWKRGGSASVSINGTTAIADTTAPGHVSTDMTAELGAATTVPLDVTGDLRYSIEVYSSERHRPLPDDTDVRGYGYVFGGANSTMQPAELRVFIW